MERWKEICPSVLKLKVAPIEEMMSKTHLRNVHCYLPMVCPFEGRIE